jgi:hypothetical protein
MSFLKTLPGYDYFSSGKYKELPASLAYFASEWRKGHGPLTIPKLWMTAQKGQPTGEMKLLPLSEILLFHPVRGASERETAGAKLNARRDAVKAYLTAHKDDERINISDDVINRDIPLMKSTDPMDATIITPLLQLERNIVLKLLKKYPRATRAAIAKVKEEIEKEIADYNASITAGVVPSHTTLNRLRRNREKVHFPLHMEPLYEGKIPEKTGMHPFYFCTSGQGRLQAIKEAALEAGVDPSKIFVEMRMMRVNRHLCNLLIIVANEFRIDGEFSDPRHALDNYIIPMAKSCNPAGPQLEDILSLYQEMSLGPENKRKYTITNSKAFNEPSFNDDPINVSDPYPNFFKYPLEIAGGKRNTRRGRKINHRRKTRSRKH